MIFSLRDFSHRRNNSAIILVVMLLALLACHTTFAGGVPKKTFPRLGGYKIGNTPYTGYSDPEYHRQIARLDYAIIGGLSQSINADAAAIRRLNPDIVLAKYTSLMEVSETFKGYSEIKRNKVNSERGPNQTNAADWWARDSEGNHVSDWPGNWTVNITRYVQPDADGLRYPQWAARLDHEWWLDDDVWDAVFEDTVFWKPRFSADWSGGKESDRGTIYSEFRKGHVEYWNEIRRLSPDMMIVVNHDWFLSEYPNALGRWDLPEYEKQANGGMIEAVMQSSDLVNPRTPWKDVMFFYNRASAYFRDPNLTIFIVRGEPDNYRFFRYTFATCLMDDGYFDYQPYGSFAYGTVEWFDEFDLAGTAGTDWLGLAIDAPPTSDWRSGVWRRDFEGGIALVNPKGNGVRTVTVESGFRHIDGKQDRQVNNGQPAGQITLQDGDGIVLVRERGVKAPSVPKPPVLNPE